MVRVHILFVTEMNNRSANNAELYKKLMELGYIEEIINKDNILKFYRDLKLEDLKIEKIDKEVTGFSNLESISLSRNDIQIIENLPASIREVACFYNSISHMKVLKPYENIVYLGLGYNKFGDNVFGI